MKRRRSFFSFPFRPPLVSITHVLPDAGEEGVGAGRDEVMRKLLELIFSRKRGGEREKRER